MNTERETASGRRLIFISCGQRTEEERATGKAVAEFVRSRGFDAYFADEISKLDSLAACIFDNLARASGVIFLLHEREQVSGSRGPFVRASVWIQQEISMLAFLQQYDKVSLPVLAFKDAAVKVEGVAESLILNAPPIPPLPNLLEAVSGWMDRAEFPERPSGNLGRFKTLLRASSWRKETISQHEKLFCERDDAFNVVVGYGEEQFEGEAWTERFANKKARRCTLYLNHGQHTLTELGFVYCDGARYVIPIPEKEPRNGSDIFFLRRDSLEFLLGKRLEDPSWPFEDGLRIAGIEVRA